MREANNDIEINLIVLDLMMPEKNGYEVLEEIRTQSNIPVIILSAMEDEISQLKGFDLEADDYVDQPVRELSLGQRMRGEFICALIHSPKLVILDEPTIGIDVQTKKKMMEMILKINEQKNTTFMITSHDFQEIEKVSQKIIILDKGENAYQGSIEDFKNQYSFLKKIMLEHEQGKAIKVTHPNIKELARNITSTEFFFDTRNLSEEHAIAFFKKEYSSNNVEVSNLSLSELMTVKKVLK